MIVIFDSHLGLADCDFVRSFCEVPHVQVLKVSRVVHEVAVEKRVCIGCEDRRGVPEEASESVQPDDAEILQRGKRRARRCDGLEAAEANYSKRLALPQRRDLGLDHRRRAASHTDSVYASTPHTIHTQSI